MTETNYYLHLKSTLRESLLELKISRERGDPLRLVEAAAEAVGDARRAARAAQDDNLRFDQVWCVVDVDEHARLPMAIALAKKKSICIVVSNPCFELWALLHFVPHTAPLTAAEACDRLKKHMPGYDKRLDCSLLVPRYTTARSNAQALARIHEATGSQPASNPSTDAWRLNEALYAAAAEAGPVRRRGARP